ncbi:hypothetical protein [Terracidiphilus sp.]|jgi:hypothetical protein|uniref:hypothetical protein n=1 Tax=Terracidiphilus sp. TaxID=1964191 RepID=UPI003C1BDA28
MTKPFHGARLKIKRANKHINDLATEIRKIGNSDPYNITVEDDLHTGNSFLHFSMKQAVDDDLLTIVGDALHNLRSALDHAISDIEFDTTGKREDKTSFLMRATREGLIGAVNGGFKEKAPEEVRDFIVDEIQPYAGGNGDALWNLHRLDIEDKHVILLAKKELTYIRNIRCEDGRGEQFTINEWAVNYPTGNTFVCDRKKVKVTDKGHATVGVVFGNGLPFYGHNVIPTLRGLSNFVSRTLDSIERVWLASRKS